jgi:methionyl-tRNA synthetase
MMTQYWQNSFGHWGMPLGMMWLVPLGILVIFLAVIWSVVWKALALWHAAREGDKVWFIILLLVNTLGILEILYIYVFSKKRERVV